MKILRVVLFCAVAAAASANAQKSCSAADAAAAQKVIDKILSWQNLENAFRDYGHCDTGNVDESFTDALMRLMIGWKNVDVIAAATARDAAYKAWVHRHVMSPMAKDDREDLYALARKSCPAKQDAFCTDLAHVVKGGKGAPGSSSDTISFEPLKPSTQPLNSIPTIK